MADYKRASQKFVCAGLDLNHPVDLLPIGKYPYMKNIRSYRDGIVEGRQGLTKINTTATTPDKDIHSYARLNDYVTGNFARFLGIGTALYFGTNSFTQIDTGYSGVPLSIIPYRPSQSPRVWAYIGDFTRMRKANTDGTNREMGIAPPTVMPVTELTDPGYGSSATFESTSGWTNQGTAGAISVSARLTGVTIGDILYINGTTGWAAVAPTGGNTGDILAGMELQMNFGGGNYEQAIVEEVHKIYTLAGNTIAAITYDSGSTGLCTIQPATPLSGMRRNAMLKLGGSENIRIISVTNGPGGLSSFRCSTVGTFAAGASIVPPAAGSFWVHLSNTHAAGEGITSPFLSSTITTGVGTLAFNTGSPGLNLGSVPLTGGSFRPLGPDDYIHIGIQIDKPELLTEGKLVLDVDAGTTGTYAATDGNKNSFYRSFRPNDLQGVVKDTITSVQARADGLTAQQQDKSALDFATGQNPAAVYGSGAAGTPVDQEFVSDALLNTQAGYAAQLTAGSTQWVEFRWKIADLTRIGGDPNVDLSAVRAIQLRFVTTGNIVVGASYLWVGGSFGPDTNVDLTPYLYRYRYRASETGAKSLPGPATRSGIISFRQAVLVTPTVSTDPQVDKIDFERFGGPTDPDGMIHWHYVGTLPNDGSTFFDDQFNAAVVLNEGLETDAHQPFTISDEPKTSVVGVAGTAVTWVSGDKFNVKWARGTEVIINGKLSTLSSAPVSDTLMHITDSLGAATAATLEIREPILTGQPLPYMWGPYYETLFGCGNLLDVGSVYYTKAGDPDSSPDTNYIEVVSPSETMMNGCLYDGRAFAWSNKRMFTIVPAFSKPSTFQFVEVPNGKGLFDPWAFAVGPEIYFLSADGIYATNGGVPVCISNDIRPIFPAGDKPGVRVNDINPIKLQNPGFSEQGPFLRFCYHNGYLFFDYLDCNDNPQSLVYDTERKAWYHDVYFEGTTEFMRFHYSEYAIEGNDDVYRLIAVSSAGFVYENLGCKDGTLDIKGVIRTPALDVGDSRANKVFGDIVFDMNTNGIDVKCDVYLNNYTILFATKTYNTTERGITPPIDLSLGSGKLARNIGVELSWTVSTI